MLKKTTAIIIFLIAILEGLYILHLKNQYSLVAQAHSYMRVIIVLEEIQGRLEERNGNAIREIIIRKTAEKLKLKKIIIENNLNIPDYADEIVDVYERQEVSGCD